MADATKAWDKAFTQGSKAMQDRLKKVHQKNPAFQSWLKSSGHAAGASVKQASKEVKPSERVKSLQAKSTQAYGATKGVKVGGEFGSGEMRDTIKPLTRDQWSKVHAAERAAKAAAKKPPEKTSKPAAAKKPLTQDERMAAIRKALAKAKAKDRFDVPTVNPDDADHDDLMDVHQSLHVRRGYNEETKPDASMAMTHNLKMKMISDKDKRTLGKVAALMASQKNKDKKNAYVRQLGLKAMKAGEVDPARGHSPTRFGREALRKEEFEQIDEVTKKEAEKTLGGPVKEKPTMPPGKQPAGYRYVRGLARKAMKAGLKKEEIEPVVEQDDTMEKKEMAQTQLHFMKYAAEEILEFIKMGGEIEEWYQNKLSKVHSDMEGLHSYIEGEKRRTGMVEEVEQIDEKMNLAKAKMGDVIKDFQKSKAPQFKGKSMEKRREMAIAAKLGAEREAKNEEVENVAEGYKDGRGGYKKFSGSGSYKQPLLGKEGSKRKRHISDIVQSLHSMDASKPISADHHATILKKLERLKEEVVAEAEGTVAVTPKEKDLAAHHGDKTRITYGDVIKARLKSAAAKKMGK